MSMLAEQKRRKTYNLVPRGKPLYEDDCRLGTKLLMKMGWNKEKGLGARGDGNLEFIRVQYKQNVEGLGYELRDDQWTQHEKNFSGLLENLKGTTAEGNNEDGTFDEETPTSVGFGFSTQRTKKTEKLTEKISGESLEEKSKNSKARVHYKKFTRGKDLSQYSEKDLANIFGKKVEQSFGDAIYEQFTSITVEQPNSESEKEENDNFGGVQTIHRGISAGDYFKQKMEAMRNKLKTKSEAALEHEHVELLDTTHEVSKKRARSPEIEADAEEQLPKKKKRKSKKEHTIEDNHEQTNFTELQVDEKQSSDLTTYNKKKSKKASKKSKSTSENGDHEETNFTESQVCEDQPNDSAIDSKKKCKKALKKSKSVCENEEPSVHSEKNVETTDLQPIYPNDTGLELCSEVVNELNEKRKKSKKSKTKNDEISEPEISSDSNKNMDIENTDFQAVNGNDSALCSKNKQKKTKASKHEIPQKEVADIPQNIDEASRTRIVEFTDNAKVPNNSTQTLTLEEMREHVKRFDEIDVSTFSAERFRNCQLNSFEGSNLANITGYSLNSNLQLKIQKNDGDDEKILNLWNGKINKYEHEKSKYSYMKYVKNINNARQRNAKMPTLHVKAWKRKQLFKTI